MHEIITKADQLKDIFDVAAIKRDFPIFQRDISGKALVYLDSAATSQKPKVVLDKVCEYYEKHNANVHRGVHTLGTEATSAFENARERVAQFIDADPRGLIFVRNTTEALNLVASSYAERLLKPGDRIVLTEAEHHSNLVPWQLAAERAKLKLAFLHVNNVGSLDLDEVAQLVRPPTKLLSSYHQGSVLGAINPIKAICKLAHENDVLVCVDAAQSVPHMSVSVQDLDCDFLAFSGHKMCGPMGAGVLWARPELLEQMPPFMSGGSMIFRVGLEQSSWNEVPHKFEAGTPDVASAVGLASACDYLSRLTFEQIHAQDRVLVTKLLRMLSEFSEIMVYGARDPMLHGSVVSFNVADVHAHDVGTILDRCGVEVRAGHHCCQPLMNRLGVAATVRASVYFYNSITDIEALGEGLQEVQRVFQVGHQ